MALSQQKIFSVPSVGQSQTLSAYLKEILSAFKSVLPPGEFVDKLSKMGFSSRAVYRKILSGNRRLSSAKLMAIAKELDLSSQEIVDFERLAANPFKHGNSNKSRVCHTEVLAHPINTIVLNLCALGKGKEEGELCESLSRFFRPSEVSKALALLLSSGLVAKEESRYRRILESALWTPPGVKTEFGRSYLSESLKLAARAQDLDLSEREFSSFSSRIKYEDLPKLKEYVRQFLHNVDQLADGETDAVVQINVNAFLVARPEATKR